MSGNRRLRWAVLGTWAIADGMAQALRSMGRTLDALRREWGVVYPEKE